MNQKRNAELSDLELLNKTLDCNVSEEIKEIFTKMRDTITAGQRYGLSFRQRQWVLDELEKHAPEYANLVSTGQCPRGREVETPAVLRNLPKRPPSKPRIDDE